MRRMAWNACRSCSAHSSSMWADSLASHADAGCTRSPAASSTAVTGCWASQSISRSGWWRAQLLGDGEVAPGVAEADGRGQVERPLGAREGARPRDRRGRRVGGRTRSTKSLISRLTSTGSRPCGPWPPPSTVTSGPPVSSASRSPTAWGRMRSSRAVDHEDRAAHPGAQLFRWRQVAAVAAEPAGGRVGERARASISWPQPTQSSICLVEWGSREHLPEEEAGGSRRSRRRASGGGCTWPSPRWCRARRPTRGAPARGGGRRARTAGPMRDQARDPVRGGRRQPGAPSRPAAREADERWPGRCRWRPSPRRRRRRTRASA